MYKTTENDFHIQSRSTNEGGRGCHTYVPVSGGDGTKIASTWDLFDQPSGEMSWIRGKLANHVGNHVVLSPDGVLVTSQGTESSYPRPSNRWNTLQRIYTHQVYKQYSS